MRLTLSELSARAAEARAHYGACDLCGHDCRVDRTHGPAGRCAEGDGLFLAGAGLHFGEEPALVGRPEAAREPATGPAAEPVEGPAAGTGGRPAARHGSGLIQIGGCNMACVACETAEISQQRRGLVSVSAAGFGALCLRLAEEGAANLNLVTPTHVLPAILDGLCEARRAGCDLPVVWNCGGYESLSALRLLDGVVDVYLPDAKVGDEADALAYTGAPRYPEVLASALAEMHRQVGPLRVGPDGLAVRGVIVRHLILPDGAGAPAAVFRICAEVSRDLTVNLMTQYRPAHIARAVLGPPAPEQRATPARSDFLLGALRRRPSRADVAAALKLARAAGLTRLLMDGAPAP
jgi:putative pyruvate formate lyase activating enzyme